MAQPNANQNLTAADAAITRLRVLSSGSGGLHKEHRDGTWLPQLWWVLTSQSWVEVPLSYFVIEHRDGLVLFDTGADPAIASDPNYISSPIGQFLLHRIFRMKIRPDDALDRKLQSLGLSAADVRIAVLSHLHFDHVGGIAHIPQAELMVSRDEWAQLAGPHPEREWILREHIELPDARWRPFDLAKTDDPLFTAFGRCYDLMGDGSMILLPTPGHTQGSVSMLVRSAGWPPLLLIGDLAYRTDMLLTDRVPGTGDPKRLRAAYAKVRALKEKLPDLVILPSHDPGTAHMLTQAIG